MEELIYKSITSPERDGKINPYLKMLYLMMIGKPNWDIPAYRQNPEIFYTINDMRNEGITTIGQLEHVLIYAFCHYGEKEYENFNAKVKQIGPVNWKAKP